jgi:hypothetical protein
MCGTRRFTLDPVLLNGTTAGALISGNCVILVPVLLYGTTAGASISDNCAAADPVLHWGWTAGALISSNCAKFEVGCFLKVNRQVKLYTQTLAFELRK